MPGSYIWFGVDVDGQLRDVRENVRKAEEKYNVRNSNLTLPLHISLKMSFPVSRGIRADVISFLEDYFRSLKPFGIPVKGFELYGNIAWIRMRENPALDRIHDELNRLLSDRFGTGMHEYDLDYIFHTTLVMDDDEDLVRRVYTDISSSPCPEKLTARRYLIGESPDGSLGSYRVIRKIDV